MELRKLSIPRYRVITFFFLILIFCSNIIAQIRIKERVEIKPDSVIEYDKTFKVLPGQKDNATLKVEFTNSPGVETYFLFRMGNGNYDRTTTGGNFSFEIPNTVGYYSFHWGFMDETKQNLISDCYQVKMYFNDFLVYISEDCAERAFGYGYMLCDNPGFTFYRDLQMLTEY